MADSEANRSFSLPMEIDSEIKIKWNIPFSMLVSGGVFLFLATSTQSYIYSGLQLAWLIVNPAIGLILAIRNKDMGGKRIYSRLIMFLMRDKKTYMPIDNPLEYDEMKQPSKKIFPGTE